VKIRAGNPNRRMAEVAVTLLRKTCPKRGTITLIVRLQKNELKRWICVFKVVVFGD
jgi:hypothetical protein